DSHAQIVLRSIGAIIIISPLRFLFASLGDDEGYGYFANCLFLHAGWGIIGRQYEKHCERADGYSARYRRSFWHGRYFRRTTKYSGGSVGSRWRCSGCGYHSPGLEILESGKGRNRRRLSSFLYRRKRNACRDCNEPYRKCLLICGGHGIMVCWPSA